MIDNRFILLIEDNLSDEKLTVRALRHSQIANEVRVARNGEEALNILFSDSPLPSVVFLDLKLPKISGLTVLQQIRANEDTRLLPVVVLTSSTEQADIIESYSLGANSYVCKPVDFEEFTQAIGQVGLFWLLLNENQPKPTSSADGTRLQEPIPKDSVDVVPVPTDAEPHSLIALVHRL